MYISVLKNREQELKIIKEHNGLFTKDMLPLIEIIKQRFRGKFYTLDEMIRSYDSLLPEGYLIDFFTFSDGEYKNFKSENVDFSISIRGQKIEEYMSMLMMVSASKSGIPVISIKDARPLFNGDILYESIKRLKSIKKRIAIRLQARHFQRYFKLLDTVLESQDILIYDINESMIQSNFFDTNLQKTKKGNYTSIILHSPRHRDLYNKTYPDGEYTNIIDNSISKDFSTYNFDGFGDYAGLKDDLPSDGGGKGYAIGLMYVNDVHQFFSIVAKESHNKDLRFEYVTKQIIDKHLSLLDPDGTCPAIYHINSKHYQTGKYGNFSNWVYITLLRYLSQTKKAIHSQT